MSNYIATHQQSKFYLQHPEKNRYDIEEIAHHLSMIPRFGGALNNFYSVAEHSVMVAQNCPKPLRLLGLLHDAAEAYVGDNLTPVKIMFPALQRLETKIQSEILARYGIKDSVSRIKPWDHACMIREWETGTEKKCFWETGTLAPLKKFKMLNLFPPNAKKLFINKFNNLWLERVK